MDIPLPVAISTTLTILSLIIAGYAVTLSRRNVDTNLGSTIAAETQRLYEQRLALMKVTLDDMERKYAALAVQCEAATAHSERCETELARLRIRLEILTAGRDDHT